MKPRRGRSGILYLVLLLGLPTALATDAPAIPGCLSPSGNCQEPVDPIPEEPAGPPVAVAAPVLLSPVVDDFRRFVADVSLAVQRATEAAIDGAWSALAASGQAILGLLTAFAQFLLAYKPATLDPTAYAALVAAATGAVAFAGQASVWWTGRKLASLLPAIPLFSRIEKDELLENGRRARLFEFIRHNPGARLGEISKALGLPWGSTLHHLRKLRSERLVTFKQTGHHKCYFINGSGLSEHQMTAVSVLKGDTLQRIARFIEAHPRTNLKDLASAMQISSPLAAFHVRKLEIAGLVVKQRDGKEIRLEMAGPVAATPVPVAPLALIRGSALPAPAV